MILPRNILPGFRSFRFCHTEALKLSAEGTNAPGFCGVLATLIRLEEVPKAFTILFTTRRSSSGRFDTVLTKVGGLSWPESSKTFCSIAPSATATSRCVGTVSMIPSPCSPRRVTCPAYDTCPCIRKRLANAYRRLLPYRPVGPDALLVSSVVEGLRDSQARPSNTGGLPNWRLLRRPGTIMARPRWQPPAQTGSRDLPVFHRNPGLPNSRPNRPSCYPQPKKIRGTLRMIDWIPALTDQSRVRHSRQWEGSRADRVRTCVSTACGDRMTGLKANRRSMATFGPNFTSIHLLNPHITLADETT